MNNELVSIIMSVYDGDSPEFFSESIQSIIDQDYANIEIILIGDGVKNNLLISSIELIVNNNKHIIRYFPQEINSGLARCMNKAISPRYTFPKLYHRQSASRRGSVIFINVLLIHRSSPRPEEG